MAQVAARDTKVGGVPFPPRPPAFSPGFTSAVWGICLGAFVWFGLLAIGVSGATAFLSGVISAVLIFFYVRLYGADPLNR
jgi:hypothetical protein